MSFERMKEAKLEGYRGPLFPTGIDDLNKAFRDTPINEFCWLEETVRYLSSYVGVTRPQTSDGYHWFVAITLNAKNGFLVVAFPHKPTSRSIAFYFQGDVTPEEIKEVVEKLTAHIGQIPYVVGQPKHIR